MSRRLYESDFEETTIERLQRLGYDYTPIYELHGRSELTEVVLKGRLTEFLQKKYPFVPKEAVHTLSNLFMNPDGISLEQRNQSFHEMLVKGFDFRYEDGGQEKFIHACPIDWHDEQNNDFLVINQLPIQGRMSRRPDILIYINGLPLIIFELKSPYDENATIDNAYTQIRNYTYDIAQLFNYNSFCVISDGSKTLHGIPGADLDYFAAWKSIDGRNIDNNEANSMRTLIEGLFPKQRLLNYIRNFIVFMKDEDQTTKMGAKYHQYFGVNFAVDEAIRATRPQGDRKIGVIWHTQGSGKSISMLFFAGLLIRHTAMDNPTIVVQVDRTDLDDQLFETFTMGHSLIGYVHQADSADQLRELLRNESGQIIFTTIEKFRLKEKEGEHPVLSDRRNIIVIADEAHRTQYEDSGFAGHLKRALPNASHIGFTGTPIDFADRSTVEVFGNVIHTYDMLQSVEDKATVPIYYESRLIPLDLTNANLDEDYNQIIANADSGDEIERNRAKWAALEKVVGTEKRLKSLAQDILSHFSQSASPQSKGMIVCMSRQICVSLYNQMRKLPNCPQIEVIMTGDVSKDPPEWREKQSGSNYSHIKTREEKEEIKAKLRNPQDPLKFVIVRDMWLTGFDAKPLSCLYVDKPMKGHNLMQALARVNRVFPNKTGGIVVDYIGIADALKEATTKYTRGGGTGTPTFDIKIAVKLFKNNLAAIREFFPDNLDFRNWRALPKVEREDWIADLVNMILGERQEEFLTTQLKLAKSHQLVRHLPEVIELANEILLYEILKTQVRKLIGPGGGSGGTRTKKELEKKLNHLVEQSIEANEVIDIFSVAGIEKPDISILDEAFLSDLVKKKHVDLRLKLLQKLLEDSIRLMFKNNRPKSKSLSQLLEKTIKDYHNRVIQAADVVRVMVELRKEMDAERKLRNDLGLTEEEIAFYNIVAGLETASFSNEFIANLIHKVVSNMKNEFQVDWTNPHRHDILAKVKLAVKSVLMREKITGEQLRFLTNAIIEQAKQQFKDWPLEA